MAPADKAAARLHFGEWVHHLPGPPLGWCEVYLLLPFRFVNTMGGDVLTHAIMEECSGE
jgi:hypothetical protein